MDSRDISKRPVELWATASRNKVEKGMNKITAILGLNDSNEHVITEIGLSGS